MNTPFPIKLSAQDYLNASRYNMRSHLFSSRLGLMFLVVWVIYTAISLISAPQINATQIFISALTSFVIAAIILCGVGAIIMATLPWRTRRLFAQNKLLQMETQVQILDGGLYFTSPTGTQTLKYDMMHKWGCDRNVLLLYAAENLFYIMPRSAMNDEQYQYIISGLKQAECRYFGRRNA